MAFNQLTLGRMTYRHFFGWCVLFGCKSFSTQKKRSSLPTGTILPPTLMLTEDSFKHPLLLEKTKIWLKIFKKLRIIFFKNLAGIYFHKNWREIIFKKMAGNFTRCWWGVWPAGRRCRSRGTCRCSCSPSSSPGRPASPQCCPEARLGQHCWQPRNRFKHCFLWCWVIWSTCHFNTFLGNVTFSDSANPTQLCLPIWGKNNLFKAASFPFYSFA